MTKLNLEVGKNYFLSERETFNGSPKTRLVEVIVVEKNLSTAYAIPTGEDVKNYNKNLRYRINLRNGEVKQPYMYKAIKFYESKEQYESEKLASKLRSEAVVEVTELIHTLSTEEINEILTKYKKKWIFIKKFVIIN